jgi:hypothetical protein
LKPALNHGEILLADGTIYRLRYTRADLREILEKYGISFLKGTGFADVDETVLPELIHIGLREQHPELTLQQLEKQMSADDTQDHIFALLEAATGKRDVRPKNDDPAQQ